MFAKVLLSRVSYLFLNHIKNISLSLHRSILYTYCILYYYILTRIPGFARDLISVFISLMSNSNNIVYIVYIYVCITTIVNQILDKMCLFKKYKMLIQNKF